MAITALLGAVSGARGATAYEQIVAPIFQARCVACHGEQKQKGKLALHTWERIAQGGDSGPLWEAGKPAESELVRRLRLPMDDEEHMPPSDEPQPAAEEMALLVRWIEQGASPTATVAELKLPAALAQAAAELPAKLAAVTSTAAHAEPLWELDPVAVTKLRAPLAAKVRELQQRFPGALTYESRTSAALHFTAAGLGRNFGDEELAALAALRDELVVLDLSGTAFTDRSATVLAGFANLRVLRLGFTPAGDATVKAIATLPKLEVLALHESAAGVGSVAALKALPALRRVHLGSGGVAQAARDAGLPVVDAGVEALVPTAAEPTAAATSAPSK